MYFLETIEGSAGERLTSAVLKYLFINSGEFRRLFLKQIERDFAASEIPSFKNGVICFDEYPADDGNGFIDLVVIADNAALGIENKLWAGLTDDQPSKYLPTLEGLARERCGTGGAFRIVMLVPEQRQDEIHRELQRQNISGGASVLFWQLVMKDLNTLAQEETGEVAAVANVFHEYLSSRINDVKINADPTKLLGGVKLGNSFQHDFLKKVREVFANAGRIQAGGKDAYRWYGFYFEFSRQDGKTWVRPWFGFVQRRSGVRLMVQTKRPSFQIQDAGFTRSEEFSKTNDDWLEVAFNSSDDSIPRWRTRLQPMFDEFRRQLETPTTE